MTTATVTATDDDWVLLIGPAAELSEVLVTLDSRRAARVQIATTKPLAADNNGMTVSQLKTSLPKLPLATGESVYVKAIRHKTRVSCIWNAGTTVGSNLGWEDYTDTQYTEGSPFQMNGNVDTVLPNNGINGPKTYGPTGFNLFDTSTGKILGRTGDSLLITMEMTVERQTNSGEFDFETWWDIGGSVGELYRRYNRVRGSGLDRKILSTTLAYTLDTWEANGALTYVRSSVSVNIWGIRHLISRLPGADS